MINYYLNIKLDVGVQMSSDEIRECKESEEESFTSITHAKSIFNIYMLKLK